jgi:hypothetical protein
MRVPICTPDISDGADGGIGPDVPAVMAAKNAPRS